MNFGASWGLVVRGLLATAAYDDFDKWGGIEFCVVEIWASWRAISSSFAFMPSSMSRISLKDQSDSAERSRMILTNLESREIDPSSFVLDWSLSS